ncbi:exodeoxyribonuclease III [Kiritimatiella glycovorans]|uniref:Exodeoxyribonuclease III n=1 Tax=Kiritimatiella glycovorans TaxID=1307763 RepID=A0A0G3EFM4_9BACT|nr:exodeoxyribonuclease III [Kiritimatiella glycovorans]AKJ65266.1 Exodeoxyribonuclease III [Kiritimatiella glycovorans]
MKIATFNVNSIRTRLPIVLDWLKEHEPDVLAVQETKTPDDQFPAGEIEAAGYRVGYRGFKGGAGVAVISRDEPEEVRFGFDDGGPADEDRLIEARWPGLTLINTYVPQGRSIDHEMYAYKLEWLGRLRRYLARRHDSEEPLIWVGDLNVARGPNDVAKPENKKKHVCYHEDVRAAFEEVLEFGFEDVFRRHHPDEKLFSFYDYRVKDALGTNRGWRVDYILATEPLAERCTGCAIDLEPRRRERPSDHTVVHADFDCPPGRTGG